MLEDGGAASDVGQSHVHVLVEPPRPHQRLLMIVVVVIVVEEVVLRGKGEMRNDEREMYRR